MLFVVDEVQVVVDKQVSQQPRWRMGPSHSCQRPTDKDFILNQSTDSGIQAGTLHPTFLEVDQG
jgi:hypothetical protein